MKTLGQKTPLPIANHTSVVHNNKMYLFGGGGGMCENKELFMLDLETYRWSVLKPQIKNNDTDNDPVTRDEHSCIVYDDSLIVFGGFSVGEKTNSIFKYHFRSNTWEQIHAKGKARPSPRVGHSAVLYQDDNHGDCMYIFGGKDDENNKVSDLWKFNFETLQWTCIEAVGEPLPRSGHSASNYKKHLMIIYGGIYEITKELNDMHIFDL